MGPLPDLTGIFYLAIVGLIALAVTFIIGIPLLIWWGLHHIVII